MTKRTRSRARTSSDRKSDNENGDQAAAAPLDEPEERPRRRNRRLLPAQAAGEPGGELRGESPSHGRAADPTAAAQDGTQTQGSAQGPAGNRPSPPAGEMLRPRAPEASDDPVGDGVADGEDAVEDLSLEDLADVEEQLLRHPLHDFSSLELKQDHSNRPLWVCPDGSIFLETYSPIYKQAYDFLIAVAEPSSRPSAVHEYRLTEHSLYAAVSTGLDTETIVSVLNRLSKVELCDEVLGSIRRSTANYGKVKLVLDRSRFFVESAEPRVLHFLMRDSTIQEAMVQAPGTALVRGRKLRDTAAVDLALTGMQDDDSKDDKLWSSRASPPPQQPQQQQQQQRRPQQQRQQAIGSFPDDPLEEEMEAAFGASGGPAAGFHDDPLEEEMEAAFGPAASAPPRAPLSAAAPPNPPRQQQQQQPSEGLGARAPPSTVANGRQPQQDPPMAPDEPTDLDVEDDTLYSFEVKPESVDRVKERCLPSELNYPMLDEYDFKNDTGNPDVPHLDLKPTVRHRPYQEKSLARMFGNGRARSGIIVLPCGAGKSLVGISAAQCVRKSCLCLVTNAVSVDQWHAEFKRWTTLEDHQLMRFTANLREPLPEDGRLNICITTYSMMAYSGKRSEQSNKIMSAITQQDWGLLLMDEVHVVPAQMFRKVVGIVKSHCKLGLTATLVREDTLIGDLNFLIGPKLYEANWLDLTRDGHIANVQSSEVWCPMTREFFREYLKPTNAQRRQLLYCLNPYKFQACQFLIDYHERTRGDKVIVFSDNLFALREYAVRLKKPFICGATSHADRTRILYNFKNNPQVNTIFLSKVGDNSIDVPEANVLLQISSHAGSRRQEAQRLGRILRAKRAKPGASAEEEHNAFFYTLVSKDTQEMFYSSKRQQFLVDQGYSFKVVSNLLDGAEAEQNLHFGKRDDQLNLLAKILAVGMEEELAEEAAEEAAVRPSALANASAATAARRVVSSLSSLSGADGRLYMEYSTAPSAAGQNNRLPAAAGGAAGSGGGSGSSSRQLPPPAQQ